jgi:hypothetical protein
MVVLIEMNSVNGPAVLVLVVMEEPVVVDQAMNHHHSAALDMVLVPVLVVAMVAHPVMSRQVYTVVADTELVLEVVLVVVMVVHHRMNRLLMNHQEAMAVVLALVTEHPPDTMLELVVVIQHQLVMEDKMPHHHHSVHKLMLRMLKVSFKIQIHKSFVVQLQVVYKLTHKTLKFASFNHHLSHPQA